MEKDELQILVRTRVTSISTFTVVFKYTHSLQAYLGLYIIIGAEISYSDFSSSYGIFCSYKF